MLPERYSWEALDTVFGLFVPFRDSYVHRNRKNIPWLHRTRWLNPKTSLSLMLFLEFILAQFRAGINLPLHDPNLLSIDKYLSAHRLLIPCNVEYWSSCPVTAS